MDTLTLLNQLGFTDYEARAYVGLLRHSPVNGYELAKASGLPRANIYGVLDRLVERGAARRLDTPEGVRYSAVPSAHLLEQLETDYHRNLDAARDALQRVAAPAEFDPVWNLHDYEALLSEARTTIATATDELLIALQADEAAPLAEALRKARERGVRITTLCMQACATECGGCQGELHRYCLQPSPTTRWLLVVSDASSLVAGEIDVSGDAFAVGTRQRLIIEITSSYIRQSIAFATLADELGEDCFARLLSPNATQVLDAMHPANGFLSYLRGLLPTIPGQPPA